MLLLKPFAADQLVGWRGLWVDGVPISYGNWVEGNPDDTDGTQDCLMVWMGSGGYDGTWEDYKCAEKGAFLCGPDKCEPLGQAPWARTAGPLLCPPAGRALVAWQRAGHRRRC